MKPQAEWKRKVEEYAAAINSYVAHGNETNWESPVEEPEHGECGHLLGPLMSAIREANRTGDLNSLRQLWPPSHLPLVPILEESGQSIPTLCLLDDGAIIARIGAEYQDGYVVEIRGDEVRKVEDLEFFGSSPDGRYFATTKQDGVAITDGWLGKQVSLCPWPTEAECLHGTSATQIEGASEPITPSKLIPFPCGERVLLVSDSGIFVLSPTGAERLLPTQEMIADFLNFLAEEGEPLVLPDTPMPHGAVSADGQLIATGCQDSQHLIFNADLEVVGTVGNLSEYPHYAMFGHNGATIAFNSCHFYQGVTIGVPTKLLPGLTTKEYEEDERVTVLDAAARVYSGVTRPGEFIVGDANGYVLAFSEVGEPLWRHFVGSTIGDMAISRDGKQLVVSTYAGFISIIDLDTGEQSAATIGTGNHSETRRWLFWKNEERPLIW